MIVRIEIAIRDTDSDWNGKRTFRKKLLARIMGEVADLADDHGVVLRSIAEIRPNPKERSKPSE